MNPIVTHVMREGEWIAMYDEIPKCRRCRAPLTDPRHSLCRHCRAIVRRLHAERSEQ